MIKCPRCGELVTGDRDVCLGCGRPVPDPQRPVERRLRALVIGLFVAGALALIAGMVRNAFVHT